MSQVQVLSRAYALVVQLVERFYSPSSFMALSYSGYYASLSRSIPQFNSAQSRFRPISGIRQQGQIRQDVATITLVNVLEGQIINIVLGSIPRGPAWRRRLCGGELLLLLSEQLTLPRQGLVISYNQSFFYIARQCRGLAQLAHNQQTWVRIPLELLFNRRLKI